jgi:acetylornithine deacetylase/succinyl-diaminopimelate desuccinylase-like protein
MTTTRPLPTCLLGALLLLAASGSASAEDLALARGARDYVEGHQRELLGQFIELLSIPNTARDRADLERNATAIAAAMETRGLEPRILRLDGAAPLVVGDLRAPGAKTTIAFYAHYDGQPVDPARWTSPPFLPRLRGTGGVDLDWHTAPLDPELRVYARSAGDDKAAVFGLVRAIDALRAAGGAPRVNLRFVFEGEEESGSPHLAAYLAKYPDVLSPDAWVLCDGPVHPSRRPEVFFGARGTIALELTVYGPNHGLHSGHYGNWAPNPIADLVHLLAGFRDPQGHVLIEGFYDRVLPLSASERQALAEVPDTDATLRRELGIASTEGDGERLVYRIQAPALNLRGIRSGAVGPQASNTIQAEASASIDFRLVPDQTPERIREIVEEHLRKHGYFIVHEPPDPATRLAHAHIVKLDWSDGYAGARSPLDTAFAKALVAGVTAATSQPVVRMPMLGGSIPMYLFQGPRKTPVVGLPIANHDDNQHAEDENLRLQNLWDGIVTYAVVFGRLEELSR